MKAYYYSNQLVCDMSQPKQRQRYDPGAADRARRWQENNPERHKEYRREYMREYMRQRRAKLKNQ